MMRKIFLVLGLFIFISCDNNSSGDRNPFLRETSFSFDINLNLPLYSGLTTIGNAVYINNPNVGVRGIFVINAGIGIGNNSYLAWEASCPNHTPNSCSTMTLVGGTNCICSCEDYEYTLFTGQLLTEPNGEGNVYGLLNYQTRVNGNIITVFN
jgi:nitrite reductase/ring-hydroxylating ferredoxin subunit